MLGQKGICIGLERRYVQLPLAARWGKGLRYDIDKALRKGDKSLDFALVELRFGWHCTMKCCRRIFLDGLVLERFSDMVRQLTEFLGPAFKLEMLQHT